MKALLLNGKKEPLVWADIEAPSSDGGESIELTYAAFNRRDYWITMGLYPGVSFPCVLGSDGAGYLDGKQVIINPNMHWGDNPLVPSTDYAIRGLEYQGCFAEKVVVPSDRVHEVPDHLKMIEASALPLAGLTAYRSLIGNCKVTSKDKVLISGIGGGVALMAFQMAQAIGAEVYVTSSSAEKIEKAISMGAVAGANYREDEWANEFKKEHGGVDVVIDSAGGNGFNQLIKICNRGARIGIFGGTQGKIGEISPQHLFLKQIHLFGSTMGNDREFEDMLSFVTRHKIVPVVDKVFNARNANEALEYLSKGKQFGKIVLKIKS